MPHVHGSPLSVSARKPFRPARWTSLSLVLVSLGAVLLVSGSLSGCSSVEDDANAGGPGGSALDDDPSCKSTKDCASGEICVEGICEMQRCGTQAYESVAPLGTRSYFAVDRELLVTSDDESTRNALAGYEPTDRSFAHPSALSFSFPNLRIVDVAGGNLTGDRPESIAAVGEGSTALHVLNGRAASEVEVGFVPVAIAAGDVDADGTDEVVALSAVGEVAICRVTEGTCQKQRVDGLSGKDVTVADVDGDGFDEPVVLGDGSSGNSRIVILNLDHATTGQPEKEDLETTHTFTRIASANLDDTQAVELLALEPTTFGSNTLAFYAHRANGLAELATQDVASDAIDVYGGDLEGDGISEILILEDSGIEVFDAKGPSSIASSYKTTLTATSMGSRLVMADVDGDSPTGTLVGDPELAPGPVVPLVVMAYPPYSRTYSDGTSQMFVGNTESKSEVETTMVGLKASLEIGFELEIPAIAKATVLGKVERRVEHTTGNGRSITIGDRYSVSAKPELEGPDNGAAVLACACYHAYTYKIDDPAGKLGGSEANGRLMSLFVPVGGQSSLWSLKRYNTLAARDKTLPKIRIPYRVGDPTSYPSEMVTLDGDPVPTEDLLFTTQKSYRVSDVASVGWSLEVGQQEMQQDVSRIEVAAAASLKAGPVSAKAEVGTYFQNGYQVQVGQTASFGGSVPPIRNNPKTPEDEFNLHGYSYSPVVYRQMYGTKTADGSASDTGGYYVVTYTVDH